MQIIQYKNVTFEKYISNTDIKKQIKRISNEINLYYKNDSVIFIGILNGCFYFMHELLKSLKIEYTYKFLKVASYKGMKSLDICYDLNISNSSLQNKNILIIEDIIDTGKTVNFLKKYFQDKNVNEFKIVSLLVKEHNYALCDWFGFKINDKFVIGYGLDIDGKFRNLKYIYIKN